MTNLNKELLAACTTDFTGYSHIQDLLIAGAAPLGEVTDQFGDANNLYDEVLEYCCDYEAYARLASITELFCQYGMDIARPVIDYDDRNIINPLWSFGFYMDGELLPTLKCLLDHGLDEESAGECWDHMLTDYYNVDGELKDDFSYEMLDDAIRKILLIASYPHILDKDAELRKLIWLPYNNYEVERFRAWDEYYFEIDTSRCGAYPQVYGSLVTVKESMTGRPVWKFGFGFGPEDV